MSGSMDRFARSPRRASPRLVRWVIVAVLLLVIGALAAFVVPRFTSTPARVDVVVLTGVESAPGVVSVGPVPATVASATKIVPRESVGDGDDVPAVAADDFDDLRFLIPGLGIEALASGSDVRDAILIRPGTYVRYRTEAVKKAFLEARILVPLEMCAIGDQPGVRLDVLGAAIIGSGFDVLYRKPLFRIGAPDGDSAHPRR